MILSNSNSQKRDIIPSGSYPARCISMIDIGTIPTEYLGEKKSRTVIRLVFELPTLTKVFNPDKGEQPYVIHREFTKSLHEKSALLPFLNNWRGKALTPEDCMGFDLSKLLGAECLLSIVHNPVGDRTYANIGGISTLPKGLVCPAQFNHSLIWDYQDNFNQELVSEENDIIPNWLREKIQTSSEWKLKTNTLNESNMISDDNLNNDEPNDLPF
jgi:hypothetical protein